MDKHISLDSQSPDVTENRFSTTKTDPNGLSDVESDLDATKDLDSVVRKMLHSYEIGSKIRQLRLRKKIGLVDLGKHTSLSASMLSQLENGKLVPTLATLARIAMVFEVSLDYFFADRKRRRSFFVVRAAERLKFPDKPTSEKPDYFFECLAFGAQEKSMQAYLADFPRRLPEEVSEHCHEGAEFVHLLEGLLVLRYQGEDFSLAAGDSVYFDPAEPHSYRGTSRVPARALVVTVPPKL